MRHGHVHHCRTDKREGLHLGSAAAHYDSKVEREPEGRPVERTVLKEALVDTRSVV